MDGEEVSSVVERADIEGKVREIEQAVGDAREAAKERSVMVLAAGAGLLLLSFLWGRRKGRRGAAVVEVYRVK